MADHSSSARSRTAPDALTGSENAPAAHHLDYDLADELELTATEQYRALFEDTRRRIVQLLSERAATTQELAGALGRPKGTVGHHLKVLESAGLIHVVRTKKVRAIEAKYYGRTARVFLYHHRDAATDHPTRLLQQAVADVERLDAEAFVNANARYVRIPRERAWEWSQRLNDLLDEFAQEPRSGETVYGLTFALYATDRTDLPEASPDAAGRDMPDGAGPGQAGT